MKTKNKDVTKIINTRKNSAERAHVVESIINDMMENYDIDTIDNYIDDINTLKCELKSTNDLGMVEYYLDDLKTVCVTVHINIQE